MNDVIDLESRKRRKAKSLPKPADDWEKGLLRSHTGAVKKLAANVELVLTSHPEWRGAISWDAFAERITLTRDCPAGKSGPWTDLADVLTAVWLQRSEWRLEASPDLVASAVRAVAHANAVHPLRARLEALVWDRKPRVDTWTTTYLGAEDTEVHREMGKRWLLGAVARAFVPGSQVDTALILEGAQGLGKSTAARILSLGFFTDELADIGSKDAAMQLHGAWIVELPELDAIGRAEASRIKAFLTRRSDRYRAPYGRHVAEHGRQCVFIGTVNHNDYLTDETGGRRFLPVAVSSIDCDALRRDVEQLWAEAVVTWRNGELSYTSDVRLRELIADHAAERYQGDPWDECLSPFLKVRESTSVAECLTHVGVDRAQWDRRSQVRASKILKSRGYVRVRSRFEGKLAWHYVLPRKGNIGNDIGNSQTAENPANTIAVPNVPNVPIQWDETEQKSGVNSRVNAPIGDGRDLREHWEQAAASNAEESDDGIPF